MAGKTSGRIVKHRNPKDGLALATKVYKKHVADGSNSDLKNLQDYDWGVVGPTISVAQAAHEKAETLKGQMEEQYRIRDEAYAKIKGAVDSSAAFLKGKYRSMPKKLAEWGYEIDDTPRPRKKKAE